MLKWQLGVSHTIMYVHTFFSQHTPIEALNLNLHCFSRKILFLVKL